MTKLPGQVHAAFEDPQRSLRHTEKKSSGRNTFFPEHVLEVLANSPETYVHHDYLHNGITRHSWGLANLKDSFLV